MVLEEEDFADSFHVDFRFPFSGARFSGLSRIIINRGCYLDKKKPINPGRSTGRSASHVSFVKFGTRDGEGFAQFRKRCSGQAPDRF